MIASASVTSTKVKPSCLPVRIDFFQDCCLLRPICRGDNYSNKRTTPTRDGPWKPTSTAGRIRGGNLRKSNENPAGGQLSIIIIVVVAATTSPARVLLEVVIFIARKIDVLDIFKTGGNVPAVGAQSTMIKS